MSNMYGGITSPGWYVVDKIHYGSANSLLDNADTREDTILLGRYVLVKYTEKVFSQDERNKIIIDGTGKKLTSGTEEYTWYENYKQDGNADKDCMIFIKVFESNILTYKPVTRINPTLSEQFVLDKIGEIGKGNTVKNYVDSEIDILEGIDAGLREDVDNNISKLNTLINEDPNKSVRTIANEELAKQLLGDNNAEDNFKTLQDLAAWLEDHPEDVEDMNTRISENTSAITTLNKTDGTVGSVKKTVDDAISNLVNNGQVKVNTTNIATHTIQIGNNSTNIGKLQNQVATLVYTIKIEFTPSQWDTYKNNVTQFVADYGTNYVAVINTEEDAKEIWGVTNLGSGNTWMMLGYTAITKMKWQTF